MNPQQILQEAENIQEELVEIRRTLHQHPEVGFDLTFTKAYVKEQLEQMGYEVTELGKAGLVVLVGGKKPGKTMMLRADMDALAMTEEADVPYRSTIDGKMHGCGHDMHTTMLLGAAKVLKAHEEELEGTVKLVFQPAEEIFQGATDMIEHGVLENPTVDAAFMMHVAAGTQVPSGMLMIPGGGISMMSCEQYHITITGKSGHGSMPSASVDAITAAAQIHLTLQEINSRELPPEEYGVFTTCKFQAGETSNVFPETAQMWGTIRTLDTKDGKTGGYIKKRMTEIAEGIATAMRCQAQVEFYDYCPTMMIDTDLADKTLPILRELCGDMAIDMSAVNGGKPGGGSEDFSFVSHQVPTMAIYISAGSQQEGYVYGQHNSKVCFNDAILYRGSAAYAYMAYRWLQMC
jgi:hippurate hydrolase